ncbi:MAG TPA: DUF6152 family protein [Gammaproteobacteria bacterium]|nr:DUF6152 family protein [Gammaproteobacteria bacterium]
MKTGSILPIVRRQAIRMCAPLVVALCVSMVAEAHHSRALYDTTKEVVIEGTVAELEWRNPHVSLTVETKSADGTAVRRDIEVMSVSEARALGLRQEALAVGSRVAVIAHPGRSSPTARAVGLTVRTSDGTVFPLNTDSRLTLAPTASVEAQSLAGRWAPSLEDFGATFNSTFRWPFTEQARAALAAAISEPNAALGICADFPPPLLSVFPDLREIEIGDSTISMRFEAQGQDVTRVIHLDQAQHPANVAPSLLGHSIGRWEGQTLVVDTTAFALHPVGIGIAVPSGPSKHLVERFALTEDRRHLRYDLTIEDPAGLTAPASLSSQWEYRPDLEPSGVPCDAEMARRLIER